MGGGTILSTRDAVTFSFGLEQVDQATRNELVKRSLSYLLPATADTTPPTVAGFKYPANNAVATPNDPVEVEVTAFDERGDMEQVQLFADGQPYATVPVYPFQFRYSPPASAVGKTVDAHRGGDGQGGELDDLRHAQRERGRGLCPYRVPRSVG